MTFRPDPLFQEKIDRIKISADAIVDCIQSNDQNRPSPGREPFTFREDFHAGKATQRFAFGKLCGPLRITWSQRKHE